jgi:Protein of unknown function (DUF2752)
MKRVPWLALGVLAAGLGAWAVAQLSPMADLLPGCVFKRLTGVPCVTCGLTRCAMALGRWDWTTAFHWHPVAAGLSVLLPGFALWDLRRAWRGEDYPPLPDSRAVRYSLWALLVVTWALQVARGI